VQPHRRRNSFAIEKSTSPSWAEFWSERKVRIRNFGIYEFGSQLEAEYFARYPADRRS